MKSNILIFLGTNYRQDPPQIEFFLPKYLSQTRKIYCFEYPRFKRLFQLLFRRVTLIEKENSNLIIFHSFAILPYGRTFSVINAINHNMNYVIFNKFFNTDLNQFKVITFTPEISYLKKFLEAQNIIYHILEDYVTLPWWSSNRSQNQFKKLELHLLKKVQKIITVSETLLKKYSKKGINIYLYKTPAQLPLKHPVKIPHQLQTIKKPIVGFIGTMFEFKIDTELLKILIEQNPQISFIFMGKICFHQKKYHQLINNLKNSFYLGYVKNEQLNNFISNFDICIIPYNTNKYGLSAYPVKINQYLYFGKPTVTTTLPSIKYLAEKKLIYMAKTRKEFELLINKLISVKENKNIVDKRYKEALKNSWTNRIEDYINIISD